MAAGTDDSGTPTTISASTHTAVRFNPSLRGTTVPGGGGASFASLIPNFSLTPTINYKNNNNKQQQQAIKYNIQHGPH